MKKLALLLVVLILATIPAATVSAAVVKPVAQQAPALPVQTPGSRCPTYTILYAKTVKPPWSYTISGAVTFRYAGKVSGVPNSPIYISERVYNLKTKSWGPWKYWTTWETDSNGYFAQDVTSYFVIKVQAEFRGTNTLMGSTSNVIGV